jgi:hypothetical protein
LFVNTIEITNTTVGGYSTELQYCNAVVGYGLRVDQKL